MRFGCAPPILGVDPGVTGGISFLYPDRIVAEDIPVVGGEVDVDTLVRRVREMCPRLAVIERAGAIPRQGVSSTFKYGVAYGALRSVVALCNIPYQLVTPAKWKNHFRLDAEKEKSRALAIQLWPGCGFFSRKKNHGRAEAALIALLRSGRERREMNALVSTISEPTAQDQDALGTGWMDILLTAFNRMIAEDIIEPADDEEPDPWAADMPSWRRAAAEYHGVRAGRITIVETGRENKTRPAAAATVDALVFSLRRGVGELSNADSRRRLSELNEEQLREVCSQLRNFKPEIEKMWTPEEIEALAIVWGELK
jgi:hypothetical protein